MQTGSYIAGKWYHPESDSMVKNVNPSDTDDVIATFPRAGAADALRAIEVAQKTFESWRKVPAPERGRIVWRAVEIARRRHEELAQTLSREEGKIIKEARGEITKGINVMEFYAGEGFRIEGKTLPSEAPDTFTYTLRRPLGVVGLITPWNFPWAIPVWKSAPALVAGNTVVFKPAELTPATASLMVEIFEEAGLPPGVLNMVVGSGSIVGQVIVDHPAVKALSFTGSNDIGGALYVSAARRGAKVTCEMGGKNAVVVMWDADIERVIPAVHGGAFGSTGQRCTATSRLIVHPDVKDQLLDALLEKARGIKIGNPLDETVHMGPAVDQKQLDQDMRYIEIARSEGARLLLGGELETDAGKGFFVKPTIFDNVEPPMRIFREEVFGPVLSVATASNLNEAIKMANAVEFGLTTSIFTRDIDHAMRYVEEAEAGMIHINEPTIGGEAQLPFGGVKATGVGDREMAQEGLNFFTELKTVFINFSGSGERSMIR